MSLRKTLALLFSSVFVTFGRPAPPVPAELADYHLTANKKDLNLSPAKFRNIAL